MTTSHTPGPWTIEKTFDGYGVRAPQWGYIAIHHSSGLKHWEEGQAANRLLIAAAPELLEALRLFIDVEFPHLPAMERARRYDVADAAIAKATGAA